MDTPERPTEYRISPALGVALFAALIGMVAIVQHLLEPWLGTVGAFLASGAAVWGITWALSLLPLRFERPKN